MRFRKTTAKTVVRDLRAFADWLETTNNVSKKEAASQLNETLDEFLGEDAFGTEGQLDPRGDHRD